jgi:hypothetical protein
MHASQRTRKAGEIFLVLVAGFCLAALVLDFSIHALAAIVILIVLREVVSRPALARGLLQGVQRLIPLGNAARCRNSISASTNLVQRLWHVGCRQVRSDMTVRIERI